MADPLRWYRLCPSDNYLIWTNDPPTEPGRWWYECAAEEIEPDIVTVWDFYQGEPGILSARIGDAGLRRVEEIPGRWAGPVLEPREA